MARYSKVGTSGQDRFQICFKDSQTLELIRHKLCTSSAIIASYFDTISGCIAFCQNLDISPELWEATKTTLESCSRRMRLHERTANLLLVQSDETRKILSAIIEFRNDETSIKSSHMMGDMMKVLTELGASAKQENASLVTLTEKTCEDSRFIKTLTFIAMLYLPTSLVATIFSSNLLQLVAVGNNAGDNPTRFVLATQFWVFPTLTFTLLGLTVISAVLFDRSQKRKCLITDF
ncbi:hypothetical protein B0J14DRAFT_648559 [Halenospora varia]|nr:hypothetical protein B0J14DRAFT_648559 [Halenospora varia]